jgi:glycosyltransferase involved in cell wall biosynthesis
MIQRKPRPPVELTSRSLRVARPARAGTRVLVGVACRAPAGEDLAACLQSILEQEIDDLGVVLLLDGLEAPALAKELRLPTGLKERTWVLTAHCGTAARARNAILDFIDEQLPCAEWVARLDADDRFAERGSLGAAVHLGDRTGLPVVLGGNRVLSRDGRNLRDNSVQPGLREPAELISLLGAMANGTATNELPSCNLLVRARSGLRYPDMRSAEDHWLVAGLLFHRPNEVALLEHPLLVDYHLDGRATQDARRRQQHRRVRHALHVAVETWSRVAEMPGEILGFGQEGVIRLHEGEVIKHFYPGILSDEKAGWLGANLEAGGVVPAPRFERDATSGSWVARYPHEETRPFDDPSPEAVTRFLRGCLEQEIVCANIKRTNFRVRRDGSLVYIDVGNWVIPMDVSYFRDAAARLYSIGVAGASDEELQRRATDPSRNVVWSELPGFADFYGEVVGGWLSRRFSARAGHRETRPAAAEDVTLLIKACAMDARDFRAQVIHLVDQLSRPRRFARRALVIDPHEGKFLRQHADGDLAQVFREAHALVEAGVLDEILVGPTDSESIQEVNRRWFGVEASQTRSTDGVPVTPQVWAFDQIGTRYLLQADLDVLVGRRDLDHDYLGDMVTACQPEDTLCVAFNIPQPPGVRPYDAPPGEYKPEVRLGLLDLHRLRRLLPLPADVETGRLTTTWYRALHVAQRGQGLKTVRGGDSATFYLHPPNERKSDSSSLARVRDLVGQGWVPPSQIGRWDLEAPAEDWHYRRRPEQVVVLALGRNTPAAKVRRFAAGLAMQDFQGFGVVVIDDASDQGRPTRFQRELAWLGERLTLVRNPARLGRVANYRFGVSDLCEEPDAMVVVVDQDDALAHPAALREVLEAGATGHDVVLAAPYRPDTPTRVYEPQFSRVRETYGGDVWIHLRAFRKRLFDALPDAALEMDGRPLEYLVDYATMIPIVQQARSAVYLPRFRYWHERSTLLDADGERERDRLILRILAKGPDGVER